VLLLRREPGDRGRINHLVRDDDPARAEGPQHPRLRDVGDGERPRAPACLLGGELRCHRRLQVRCEVQPVPRAEIGVPVEVAVQRRPDQGGDR